MQRTVRDMRREDIDSIARYFVEADADFLNGMGVDIDKIPSMETWRDMLGSTLDTALTECPLHYVIWEVDGKPVGHSNIGKLTFGQEGWMHLHLWKAGTRQHGHGREFVRMSIDRYFELFELKRLNCEPYALNPAPNKILKAYGFDFIRAYITIPGILNFEQEVNSWILSRDKWLSLK